MKIQRSRPSGGSRRRVNLTVGGGPETTTPARTRLMTPANLKNAQRLAAGSNGSSLSADPPGDSGLPREQTGSTRICHRALLPVTPRRQQGARSASTRASPCHPVSGG
jgi:hypothetical protein